MFWGQSVYSSCGISICTRYTKIRQLDEPFFICGPPHRKHPPPVVDVPPAVTGAVPPNPPVPAEVSWSNKCVYLVLPRFPKFLTCMTLGRTETSIVDSVASVKSWRLRMSSPYTRHL